MFYISTGAKLYTQPSPHQDQQYDFSGAQHLCLYRLED